MCYFLLILFLKPFLLKHDLKDCKCFGSCVSWGNFSLLHVGGPSHPHGRGNPEGGNFNCGRMVSKNCMLKCCFCWFLSLNRITVAECVLNTVNLHLYFCCNICVPDSLNVFHEDQWRQFYVSSQWYLSAGQSIYCDILTVFKCIIQMMYYA